MNDLEFLETQACMADHNDHPPDKCLHCAVCTLYAETAKRMIASGDTGEGAMMRFCEAVGKAHQELVATRN